MRTLAVVCLFASTTHAAIITTGDTTCTAHTGRCATRGIELGDAADAVLQNATISYTPISQEALDWVAAHPGEPINMGLVPSANGPFTMKYGQAPNILADIHWILEGPPIRSTNTALGYNPQGANNNSGIWDVTWELEHNGNTYTNVSRIDTAFVPEPSSLWLLGAVLVLVGVRRSSRF